MGQERPERRRKARRGAARSLDRTSAIAEAARSVVLRRGAEGRSSLIAAASAVIPNGADVSWGEWNRVGMAVFASCVGSDEGFRAFDAWSAKWPNYDADYTRTRWDTYRRSPPTRIGAGTIFHLADEADPTWRENGQGAGHQKRASQADKLIALAESAELFHTSDGVGFGDIDIDGHRETWPLKSTGFRQWLLRSYFEETKGAPNREALASAIAVLEARARFDGPTQDVSMRVAGHGGKIYLDMADEEWRVIEISKNGWRIVADAPVRFYRRPGMLPLPKPTRGGNIDDLWDLINVKSEDDFALLISWMVAALRERGPYPILALRGEEGTGKSTLVHLVRSLVDPNKVPLRTFPRDERDLYIAAGNGYRDGLRQCVCSAQLAFGRPVPAGDGRRLCHTLPLHGPG